MPWADVTLQGGKGHAERVMQETRKLHHDSIGDQKPDDLSVGLAPRQQPDETGTLALSEVAGLLDVTEGAVREWLSFFQWQRRYDGSGHLFLTERDVGFLRVIKSLKEVDRSCESIVRTIHETGLKPPPSHREEVIPAHDLDPSDPMIQGLAQIETLKAELKDLHARPTRKPFWKFW